MNTDVFDQFFAGDEESMDDMIAELQELKEYQDKEDREMGDQEFVPLERQTSLPIPLVVHGSKSQRDICHTIVLQHLREMTRETASGVIHNIYKTILGNAKIPYTRGVNNLSTEIFLNALKYYEANPHTQEIGVTSNLSIVIFVSTSKGGAKTGLYNHKYCPNYCENTFMNVEIFKQCKNNPQMVIEECVRLYRQRNVVTQIVEDAIKKYPDKSNIIIPFGYSLTDVDNKIEQQGHAVVILYNRMTGEFSYLDPNIHPDRIILGILKTIFDELEINDPRVGQRVTKFRPSRYRSCVGQHAGTCSLARYVNLTHRLMINQDWKTGEEVSELDILRENVKWIVWFLKDHFGCLVDVENPLQYTPNLR